MPPKWQNETKESEIQHIIQKVTTTGKRMLDDGEMKKLKSICKLSDKYVNCAYYSLMTQLQKEHAEIRYSTLLIMNELFLRSSLFRSKLESDFDEFLQLVEETDPDKLLPPPQAVAKELKIKGLEFIKNWASKFGKKHIRLQLAVNYLRKCRKVDFDDMEARNSVQQERQHREQERLDRLINEKVSRVKTEMNELEEEISSVSTQMENCFRLLIPHSSEDLFTAADFECEENAASEDVENDTESVDSENKLRHHGFYDMKKTITIQVEKNSEITVDTTEDTSPIIENLKDLEKQISTRFYPMVTKWLKVLAKGQNCTDILKKAIDLKSVMEKNLEKYKELKIKPSKSKTDSDEDDDDFEEVKEKEGYEDTVQMHKILPKAPQPSSSKQIPCNEGSYQWKMKHHRDDVNDPTSALSTLSKRFKSSEPVALNNDGKSSSSDVKEKQTKGKKLELLEKAPVLPYDIDLYHWEEEKPLIPEVVRFDSLHKFWETKDDSEENETLKEVQIASLRTRKIDFSGKFEPVKWTCRAPLPSGKLCPRKDRYKCPFHGKIIPRDALGKPGSDVGCIPGPSTESPSQTPDWQDPQLLKDIEAATGIDLKIPDKKSKGRRKKDGLTNIKKMNNTVRERLTKKIVKRYHHYARKLDDIERKRFNDKFGDQWNYY